MNESTRLVPVVVREGEPQVWIELAEDGPEPESDGNWVMAADDGAEKIPKSMDEALDQVRPLVTVLFEKLSAVTKPPKEIELNFALKFSGKVGVFIAESTAEATIGVKLKWVPEG